MEKYGFVYIWYDTKHKRYYIGCHWGLEDDGYICSSSWMNISYKRRSQDFKRKVLSKVYTNRKDLLEEEYKWLSLIKEEELGKRYYNLHNHKFNHWIADKEKKKSVSEKISNSVKELHKDPVYRQRFLEGRKAITGISLLKETLEKKSKSMMGKNKGKVTVRYPDSDEYFHVSKDDPRLLNGEFVFTKTGKGSPISESHKEKIRKAGVFKNMNYKKEKCKYCKFIGNIGHLNRWHNERCKEKC